MADRRTPHPRGTTVDPHDRAARERGHEAHSRAARLLDPPIDLRNTREGEPMEHPATRRRPRALRLVQVATGVSGMGNGLVLAAFPLLAARMTDDPRLVVSVTVAVRLPWLLVALPAGALVDR